MHYTLLQGYGMFMGTRPFLQSSDDITVVFDDNHRLLGPSGALCSSTFSPLCLSLIRCYYINYMFLVVLPKVS